MAAVLCGERMPRGLWCLTVTRWIVAAVLAALAVTVLLLVLTVGLSKERMIVSVHHGHFQVANDLWSTDDSFRLKHYPNGHNFRAPAPAFDQEYILAGYKAANRVDIWVSMNFKTPGCNPNPNRRRSKVVSIVTAVTIFDMPNAPSFLGMVQIANLIEPKPREVCPFYRGVLDRWITINSTTTLDYIAKTYGGRSEFTAMLQVNTTTTNTDDFTAKPKNDTHYCWPVTIGHSSRSNTAEPLACRHSRGINYAAGAAVLGPPPPPSPPPPAAPSSPPPPQICELCGQN